MEHAHILYSKIVGKGSPLFILHGLLGMGDNWISLAKKYAENGFEVHLVDQRNHGRSFHSEKMNYEVMVEDLKNYADFHQIKQFNLLGHSMGGKTAMFYAMKYPEMLKKLIVVDISPKEYPPHHHFIFDAIHSVDLTENSRRFIEKQLNKKLQNLSITYFIAKNLKRKKDGGFGWKPNIEILEESLEDLGEALPPLQVYDKSVLFIKGEKSPYISKEDEKLIHAHFPNSNIVTIPDAGHWVHAEQPQKFFKISLDFLLS